MPMATATALAIAGLASSVGTSALAAKKASSASKDAAAIQVKSGDAAKKKLDEVYGPYMAAGRNALNTANASNRLMAPPPGSRYASADPTMPPPAAGGQAMPRPITLGGLRQRSPNLDIPQGASNQGPGQPPPRSMNVATFGQMATQGMGAGPQPNADMPQGASGQDPNQGPPRSMNVGTFGQTSFQPEPMVMMQAPDGSTRQVQAHLVAQYEQRGARRMQ